VSAFARLDGKRNLPPSARRELDNVDRTPSNPVRAGREFKGCEVSDLYSQVVRAYANILIPIQPRLRIQIQNWRPWSIKPDCRRLGPARRDCLKCMNCWNNRRVSRGGWI